MITKHRHGVNLKTMLFAYNYITIPFGKVDTRRKMAVNEKKICFIICYNDEMYLQDALLYIEKIQIPEGFSVENRCVFGASSMTGGYQEAMESSDAKYKIYMHQDVCILNRDFLKEILKLFSASEKIGMIGMVGTKKLPPNGCMWTTSMRTGKLRYYIFSTMDTEFDVPISKRKGYTYVEAIDGLMMITQYDLDWRTDLFKDWDFYDISQSMEFRNAGYRVIVPEQTTPWVLHNDDILNLSKYHKNRKKFLEEYFPQNKSEINLCDVMHEKYIQKSYDDIEEKLLCLLREKRYSEIGNLTYHQIEKDRYNEKIVTLYQISKIFDCEINSSVSENSSIYAVIESMDINQINHFFKKIKLYMMRKKYHLNEECQREADAFFYDNGLSNVALTCIGQLIEPNNSIS